MDKVIFFVGLPGSGKTTLSKMLSEYLSYNFYDIDSMIEENEGEKISEIFEQIGENAFRDLESITLEKTYKEDKAVISTGGGIILLKKNRDIMKNNGITIFIDRPPNIIVENIDASKRPLLIQNKQKIFDLSKERDALYREVSKIIFKSDKWHDTVEETFAKLLETIDSFYNHDIIKLNK